MRTNIKRLSNVQHKGILGVYLLDVEDTFVFGVMFQEDRHSWRSVLSPYAREFIWNRRGNECMARFTFRALYAALLDRPSFANAVMQSTSYSNYTKLRALSDHPLLGLVQTELFLNLPNYGKTSSPEKVRP